MKIQYDIARSLKKNPPSKTYGTNLGIKWLERQTKCLAELVRFDVNGISLQPREKDVEDKRTEGEGLTFESEGVLYDKDVIVVELRADGEEELISGFNRVTYLLSIGVTHFFVDVVQFESPFHKTLWKRRFNSGKDHRAMGVPNTEGTYLKGLLEAERRNEFDPSDDDAVKDALRFMSHGKKTEKWVEKLFTKFRGTNPKERYVKGLDIHRANAETKSLGLPTGGYVKDATLPSYNRNGFTRACGDIRSKLGQWSDIVDDHGGVIELTFYVKHAAHKDIASQRKKIMREFNNSMEWVRTHMIEKYHNMIVVKGFIAQIQDPDPTAGGKPLERGLVDVNGKIILDNDAPPLGYGEARSGTVVDDTFIEAERHESIDDLMKSIRDHRPSSDITRFNKSQ